MQEWEAKKTKGALENPEIWLRQVLNRKERAHARLNYFKKGTLSIKVDSSGWLYHLSLQKEQLLASLRKKSAAIKDIRFCMGDLE